MSSFRRTQFQTPQEEEGYGRTMAKARLAQMNAAGRSQDVMGRWKSTPGAPPSPLNISTTAPSGATLTDPTTNLLTDKGWASAFRKPPAVNAVSATTPTIAPAQTQDTAFAPGGFSFGAGVQDTQANTPSTPSAPVTATDHITAAVNRGHAAITALGLQIPAGRSFGSATDTKVASLSGAPQIGDELVSKYGKGYVTKGTVDSTQMATNASDYTSRLKKLAAPDYSEIGLPRYA